MKWFKEQLDLLRIIGRWIVVVILRDFIAPMFFKINYEEVGSMQLNFTDDSVEDCLVFYEDTRLDLRKVYSPWKYAHMQIRSYYLFLLYEAGYWSFERLKNFLQEPFGEVATKEEIKEWLNENKT